MQKRRTIEPSEKLIPIYNAGERVGPQTRYYVEVRNKDLEYNARGNNFLWILARLHSQQSLCVDGQALT